MLIIKLTLHCKICNGLLCPKCRFIQYKFILTTNIILRKRDLAHFSDKSFMNICCSVSVSLIVHVSLMHMVLLLECSKSRFLIAEWLAWKSKIMFGCFLTCNCALNIVVQILLSIHVRDMLGKVILRPLSSAYQVTHFICGRRYALLAIWTLAFLTMVVDVGDIRQTSCESDWI